jgi:hypothetical protein
MSATIPTLPRWTGTDPVDEGPGVEELLDVSEVAAILRVHPTTIRAMVKRDEIHPAPVPTGRVVFAKPEIRRILGHAS